jgi:exonuclease III
MNEQIAEKIEELWKALETIANETDREILRHKLQASEALFKFAANVLRSKERILDGNFNICRRDNEVAVEVSFSGIHLHTEFVPSSEPIDVIMHRFIDNPNIALKSAMALLIWALRESAQAIEDWHIKRF